ncbi:MAG: hypothetical protein L6R42_010256 [Xanthoria sp. 1 TBL-2021]|nr:MAG: hypothetical protein L6R42_010256 [Xanthoria sp. 1 TBL-2021]
MLQPLSLLLPLLSLPTPLQAQTPRTHRSQDTGMGINCQGSSQCSFTTVNSPNILREFNTTLITSHGSTPTSLPFLPPYAPNTSLPDLELFFKHEHIICARNLHWLVGSICVFLQGDKVPKDGVPGFVIKRLVNRLVRHGCKFCGSVPVSEDNNPYRLGVLTSNYVTDKGCQGVCDQRRGKVFLPADLGIWAAATGLGRDGGG